MNGWWWLVVAVALVATVRGAVDIALDRFVTRRWSHPAWAGLALALVGGLILLTSDALAPVGIVCVLWAATKAGQSWLLRDVAEGRDLGDTTTLADAAVVEEIKRRASAGGPEEE